MLFMNFSKKRISKFALFQPKHFPLLLKSLSTGPTLYYLRSNTNTITSTLRLYITITNTITNTVPH